MKRKIALALVLVLVCLSFAGCTLEKQRQSHLKFDENGNIPYNDNIYILLEDNSALLDPALNEEEIFYLTEPDVPLLLQKKYGMYAYVSMDERFIYSAGLYYCRSDIYEKVAAELKNPEMENFCYDLSYYGIYEAFLISQEDAKWLRELVQQIEPEQSDIWYSAGPEVIAKLYSCNADMFLREYAYTVYRVGLSYCLRSVDAKKGIELVYQIPAVDTPRFAAIFENSLVDYKAY